MLLSTSSARNNSSSSMDEFLENIISISSWPDQDGTSLRSWDHQSDDQEEQQQQQHQQQQLSDQMLVASFQNQVGGGSAGNGQQQEQHTENTAQIPSWNHHFAPDLSFAKVAEGAAISDPNSVKKRYRDEELHQVYEGSGQMQIEQQQQQRQERCPAPLAYDSNAPVAPVAPAGIVARPRVRARRGQATDPHSIAERLRREKIADRMKSLQELVPNANKTDKASMLDEIIDYVKFLQLQVKVLSMSRLGSTGGTMASLVADLPIEGGISSSRQLPPQIPAAAAATAAAHDGVALTENQVARLMEEDMGSAMQYLQSKGLCLMPISLATSISSRSAPPAATGAGAGSSSTTAAIAGALQQATLSDSEASVIEVNGSRTMSKPEQGLMPERNH